MEVILRTNVDGLGRQGDVVRVADGYARNYLIPKGLAVIANDKNRRILEYEKQIEQIRMTKAKRQAEQIAAKLSGVELTIPRLAGENERLFGSVTSIDIAESLLKLGFEVDRRRIELEEPIRQLGSYRVAIRLHPEISADITVNVIPQESS